MLCLRSPPEIMSVIFPTNEMSNFTCIDFGYDFSFYIDFRQNCISSIQLTQIDFLVSYEARKSDHHEKNRQNTIASKIIKNLKGKFSIQCKCIEKANLQLKTRFGRLCNLSISQKVITMISFYSS